MLDGPRSAGWRDHAGPGESRRRKFDFDFRDSEGHSGGRRRAGSDGLEDERDGLPEWCTDEEDGEMGTFDSTGAFMPMKVRLVRLSAFGTARLHDPRTNASVAHFTEGRQRDNPGGGVGV